MRKFSLSENKSVQKQEENSLEKVRKFSLTNLAPSEENTLIFNLD